MSYKCSQSFVSYFCVIFILLFDNFCNSFNVRTLSSMNRLNDNLEYRLIRSSAVPFPYQNWYSESQMGEKAYNIVTELAKTLGANPNICSNGTQKNIPINLALQRIQDNMDLLDNVAGRTPQLTRIELLLLTSTVAVSGLAPFLLNLKVVEVLVPTMAAISASIGISAEYVGKVAVSKSKEIAALAIQAGYR